MKFLSFILVGIMASILVYPCLGGPSDNWLFHRAVQLRGQEGGSCSGEQVRAPSGKDYILTAAHCLSLRDYAGRIKVIDEDGHEFLKKIIAEDSMSDLLLLEGLPEVRGLTIADEGVPRTEVRSFTSGHGFKAYKTSGVLIQLAPVQAIIYPLMSEDDEIGCLVMPKYKVGADIFGQKFCLLTVIEMATTTFTRPGSSGGMLVNAKGELVGVVSLGDDAGYGYLVTTDDINTFLAEF